MTVSKMEETTLACYRSCLNTAKNHDKSLSPQTRAQCPGRCVCPTIVRLPCGINGILLTVVFVCSSAQKVFSGTQCGFPCDRFLNLFIVSAEHSCPQAWGVFTGRGHRTLTWYAVKRSGKPRCWYVYLLEHVAIDALTFLKAPGLLRSLRSFALLLLTYAVYQTLSLGPLAPVQP